jgi:hypothetical protein
MHMMLKGSKVLHRITRYLTSRKHLAGMGLALVGAGLALADPVGPAGAALVVGFYLLGAAAVQTNPAIRRYGYDPNDVLKALRREISAVSGRVPPEVIVRIQRIELTIRAEILPRLDCLPPGSLELYLIERTARDYLPTAVDTYLRLPSGYVSSRPASLGWTPLQVLLEELDLLDTQMRRVADVVHHTDMDRLLAHRRFLNDRFSRVDASR